MEARLNSENEVEIYTSYNPVLIEKFKQNKFRWNKKCWHKNLKYVDSKFLSSFKLNDNKLKEWFQHYPASNSKPNISHLKPFQQIAVKQILNNSNIQLLADDTGLGKTIQALAVAFGLFNNNILIVCPNALKQQWADEIKRFYDCKATILSGSKQKRINTFKKYKNALNSELSALIVNWEQVRLNSFLTQHLWNFIIFDECHRLQNSKTKTYKACKKLIAHRYLYLTATPLTNNPINLYNLLRFIDPDIISYPVFINKFVVMGEVWNGQRLIKVPVAFKNVPELYNYLKPIMIRRRKEDVLNELPDVTYITYRPELTTKQRKTYIKIYNIGKENRNQRLGCLSLMQSCCNSNELIMKSDALNVLSLNEELRNNTESSKLKCLLDDVIPTINEKTVIFTQSKKMADIIHNNIKSYLVTGDTKDKQSVIEMFKKDTEIKFLVATDCLKEGVNLQMCGTLIHYDQIYSSSKMIQREGRINRIGSKQKLTVIKLVCKDTIEEDVEKILIEKNKMALQAVDGFDDDITKEMLNKIYGDDTNEMGKKN